MNKKAFITSGADLAKGVVIGLIVGALFIYLVAIKILPIFPICK